MAKISTPLSDDRTNRLRELAEEARTSPEEYLGRRVDQLLDLPDEQFRAAATHVVTKNAELYRRQS